MSGDYVHGYGEREGERLEDQGSALADLLHGGVSFAPGARVLEPGCGVGAQTLELARRSPHAHFVAVDVSEASLARARTATRAAGLDNVEFLRADLFTAPFAAESFDAAFVCFVLEHLADPDAALRALARLLKPGGRLVVIEGDHGSTLFHPESVYAKRAIQAQVDLQAAAGGDANIGRRLYPLLVGAGYRDVRVEPRYVYVDGSRPDLADAFTLKTYTAMISGVRERALAAGLMSAEDFDRGVADLARCAAPDGVFAYTFFRATALRRKG
ncbi:MAG: methyltransferase domain-containing protein [Roseiarcus sp.]